MKNLILKYKAASLLILSTVILFIVPIIQLLLFNDLIYINGEDEYSYLNYEFAKKNLSLTRLTSFAIVFLQEHGLNGSEINLLGDMLCILGMAVLIFKIIKITDGRADLNQKVISVIAFLVIPIFLSVINPIHKILTKLISSFDFLSFYIVFNHSSFPVYLRTPESQVSILILMVMLYLTLRFRYGWLFFTAIPILYFFPGIYFISILATFYLIKFVRGKLNRKFSLYEIFIIFLLYIFLGLGTKFLALNFMQPRDFIFNRYPLFGLNEIYLLGLLFLLKNFYKWDEMAENYKIIVESIVIGTLIIYNLNVISGLIIQPQHFEMEGGLACATLFLVFFNFGKLKRPNNLRKYTNILIILLLITISLFSYTSVKKHINLLRDLEKVKIIDKKFNFSSIDKQKYVFLSDIEFSSIYSGLYLNKSGYFLSAIEPAFLDNKEYYANLLLLKKIIYNNDQENKIWIKKIDQLLYFYQTNCQNWSEFLVLRRGYLSPKSNDVLVDDKKIKNNFYLIDIDSSRLRIVDDLVAK